MSAWGRTHTCLPANSHFNERRIVLMKPAFTILFLRLLATTTHGQSINQLFGFSCNPYPTCPDGTKPASIIQASDGNLYGTTAGPGGGGIFKITEAGKLTVLYTLTTNPQTGFYDQGYDPTSLAEGTDGFLYGVNSAGAPTQRAQVRFSRSARRARGSKSYRRFARVVRPERIPTAWWPQATATCTGPRAMAGVSILSRRIARAWAAA